MHRPCTSNRIRPAGEGIAALSDLRVNVSDWPPRRRDIGIASGLDVSLRWSPNTPFSAASTASRYGEDCPAPIDGAIDPSSASMLPPARRVMPRTDLYTKPVTPRVGCCVALPSTLGIRVML